jgi:hypothetical protein
MNLFGRKANKGKFSHLCNSDFSVSKAWQRYSQMTRSKPLHRFDLLDQKGVADLEKIGWKEMVKFYRKSETLEIYLLWLPQCGI